jgi:cytochrome c oxidase subunit 2
MAVLFVGWGSFFIYTLIRFRASRHPRADYGGVKSHFSTYVEVGVALVEAILLVGFAIPAWANRVDDIPNESDAVVVRVIAEQFAWNAHYPGADGVFGRTDIKLVAAENPIGLDRTDGAAKDDITTINQLNLPVNRPILIHLSSKDVIHSFSLNQMRVKQDAIPGVSFPVWFTPTKTGDWEINCSQLCGLGHYRMRGFYSIKTQQDYDTWLKEEAAALQATR